jgi:hypothetical protein
VEKSMVGAVPVSIGSFEDVHNWVDDISGDSAGTADHGPMSYELGNLAALEDEPPRPLPMRGGTPMPMPAQPMPARLPTPPGAQPAAVAPAMSANEGEAALPKKSGKGGVIGLVFLVVAAAAAAGAYFGGLVNK